MISPDSVISTACIEELDYASSFNKRLIPILHRAVKYSELPPALAELEWLPFRDDAEFESSFQLVSSAIDTDLEYVHGHTRLLMQAIEWRLAGRDRSLFLLGRMLAEARQWLAAPYKLILPHSALTAKLSSSLTATEF